MTRPQSLKPGDTVAILSPASAVDPALIDGAVKALQSRGFNTKVMAHATGRKGTYSASAGERLDDMRSALSDPAVKAILCSRGGYGAVDMLGRLIPKPVWLIGFSDISALHALWQSQGIMSIHGSMARHLAEFPADDPANQALFQILCHGTQPAYSFTTHPLSRQGSVRGQMIGGNLAVLAGLISTPYDMLKPGRILVIEDIAEPIYKVERILHQLRLNGVLENLSGLLVGQFTEYRGDSNYTDMERMIADMTAPYGYPVALGAPFGHIDGNLPFVEGAEVTLNVSDSITTITPA
ncbi:putative murein peptide carboxypeptidase [Muribaculaceae bacterium]|jgi:muramoyltetrapeptide carboxypeptidase|nr:putative murein peptide carboxypeptidase [Muribaculaceae bacterium]